MIKHYVTFLFPGSFFPNESVKQISSREEKFEIPETCFAYYFWDRQEIEHEGEILMGKEINRSGRTYFGQTFSLSEVKEKFPESTTLIFNMECNNYSKVVRTRRGNFQPVEENDTVIPA